MDDDRLASELQRRASAGSPRPDWAQRDLLPAVWREIDARPQPVLASRWSPFASVATLVVALVVLVVAVPRLAPQPPSATSTPSNTVVLSTADFAARLAAGSLNGQTVLVDGGIVAYDGPIVFGSYCGPNGPACIVGQLEGVTPRVVVFSPDIAVASTDDSAVQVSPGWPWWTRVTPPIHGRLVFSVGDVGAVDYVGRVLLDGDQLTWSVGDAAALDINTLGLDEVVLVDGWLGEIGGRLCRAPSGPTEPSLPSRYCSDEWIASEATPTARMQLQVQAGAYSEFAPNPTTQGSHVPRRGVYAVAPRLEGWCQTGTPPCWQWTVVARVDENVGAVPTPSPKPEPTVSPSPLSVMEFAARRASGSLNGKTVLVNGRIDPESRLGPVCLPIDWPCFMGVLSGADPPVDVNWRWVPATAAEANRTYDYTRTGWQSWYQAPVPVEGILVLSVDGSGQVNLIGVARDSEERLAWSVTNAATLDINSLSPDDVVLVRGWLVETESPGTTIEIDCMSPDFPRVDGLPYDYCQPHDYLSSDQPVGARGDAPEGAARLLVQRNAAQLFGASIQDGTSLFAIAPRLYGGCFHAATCWQWDVVARVETEPSATPSTPTPSNAASRFECVGPPLPPEASPDPGPVPVVLDETGLVETCAQTDAITELVGAISVSNPAEDDAIEVVWQSGVCDASMVFTFSAVPGGYRLVGDRPVDCADTGRSSLPIYVRFTVPMPAASITATIDATTPTPSPAPTPDIPPTVTQIDCPLSPDSAAPDLAPAMSVTDATGALVGCAAFAGAPEYMVLPWDTPVIRNTTPNQVQVIWPTTTCDHDVQMAVTQTAVTVRLTNESCTYRARQGQYVQLDFSQAIDAASLQGTIERAPGLPDPDPPATPRPTGNPALVGQTLQCPYDEPIGRTTELSLVDHAGVVAGCHASVTLEKPLQPVQVASSPNQLVVSWEVQSVCGSMPAQLELWGPRLRASGYTDRVLTDFDLLIDRAPQDACQGAVATQRVVLDLIVPISFDEVNAFVTRGASSTDYFDAPSTRFDFTLTADATDYSVNQPITVQASLLYTGDQGTITIAGASEYVVFGIEQLDGHFETTPISALMCGEWQLQSGVPDVRDFYKIGGYSNSDPEVERYRAYFADPLLRLPPGTYRISARVGFHLGAGTCHDQESGIGVGTSIVIRVH